MTAEQPDADFTSPAEMYEARGSGRRGPLKHHRFDTLALAVQYAVEAMSEANAKYSVIETDAQRYDAAAIRLLYSSPDYPLDKAR